MARPRRNINRRKKKQLPLIPIMVAVMVIVAAGVWLLAKGKGPAPARTKQPVVTERLKIPERPAEKPPVHEERTSAALLPPTSPPPPSPPRQRHDATVAIIIDDMGTNVGEVTRLMDIGVPLSFAVIPGLAKGKEVAEAAHGRGFPVLIHMPMEPQGYPQQRLEKNGLLLSQTDAETRERVGAFFRLVPHAVGANNHMGSRFTEEKEKMRLVVGILKEKGLFFIDSKTSPRSTGAPVARELGVPTASRDVFLDNDQDVAAITRQLQLLADKARKNGSAIGICHPHPPTIEALAVGLPALRDAGIRFVNVQELVR